MDDKFELKDEYDFSNGIRGKFISPKIIDVIPGEKFTLTVEFSNGLKIGYDCKNILTRNEHYQQLKEPFYFKKVHIDTGGHGLSWDDNVDISATEIIENGINKSWIKEVEDRLEAANKELIEKVSMKEVFSKLDK